MVDAHAPLVAFLVGADEFLVGALEPGRPHAPFRMPDGAETVPLKTVAPDRPVLDQFADGELVGKLLAQGGHSSAPSRGWRGAPQCTNVAPG